MAEALLDFFPTLTGSRQADVAKSASEAQIGGIGESIDFQREILGQTRADLAAAVDAGLIDIQDAFDMASQQFEGLDDTFALDLARGILEDPSRAMEAPGARFEFEEGGRALQNLFSRTTGGGLSSDVVRGATEFGQGLAASNIDRQLARLNPFINLAVGAKGNLANLAQGRGTQASNLRFSGASGAGNLAANIAPAIAQNFANLGFAEGAGQVSEQNARTNVLNQLLKAGGNLLFS